MWCVLAASRNASCRYIPDPRDAQSLHHSLCATSGVTSTACPCRSVGSNSGRPPAMSIDRTDLLACSICAVLIPATQSMGRREVGIFKGGKGSSHLVLLADGRLTLTLAGHSIALADILTLEGNGFKLDKQTLIRLVDKPIGRAGDAESAAQRRERIKKRVQTEKQKGNRAFLKTVAETEGISVSRLKQLLQADPTRPKPKFGRSAY